jgi:cyclase
MFTRLAPGIFSFDHRAVDGKNGIVIGARSALAIDASNDPDEGQAMAAFIQVHRRTPAHLVLTHGHGDHVLGSGAFREGEVIAHAQTPSVVRRHLPHWAKRAGIPPAQLATQVAWPTTTFSDELRIDLGGRHVRLFPTPGHSPDGICAYVEEERILFAGDTVVTNIVPSIDDGDSTDLESSLRALAKMDVAILVPGHGAILRGREQVQDGLWWMIEYIASLRVFIRDALDRGHAPDDVVDLANYARFVGDRLPVGEYGMPKRHRNAVNQITREESNKNQFCSQV